MISSSAAPPARQPEPASAVTCSAADPAPLVAGFGVTRKAVTAVRVRYPAGGRQPPLHVSVPRYVRVLAVWPAHVCSASSLPIPPPHRAAPPLSSHLEAPLIHADKASHCAAAVSETGRLISLPSLLPGFAIGAQWECHLF